MPGNFKIFISYRRKGGYDLAKLVYDRLRLDGYSVFFDIDTMRSGSFDKELEMQVNKCKDFILILSSGVFDRVSKKGYDEKEDWVRQEINCALQTDKNIIPLTQEGFVFPDALPEDIKEDLSRKNSLELSPRHFEATYERMKRSFLLSKPRWTVRHKKEIKNFALIAILVLVVYSFITAYSFHRNEVETIKHTAERDLARITDSMRATTDSMKNLLDSMRTITDSIRFTNKLEKKRMADSISHAMQDSVRKLTAKKTAQTVKPAGTQAKTSTTTKNTKRNSTQRGTR